MSETSQRVIFQWTSTQVRLSATILTGIAVYILAFPLESELRLLLAYDLAMAAYLALLIVRMAYADGAATRDLAAKKETSHQLVLALAAMLSVCSLAGVGLLLHRSQDWDPWMANLHMLLSLVAVFISWTQLHAVFGIHYARLYYDPAPPQGEPPGRRPLEFPEEELPDFWDFMYFSFTLAVCYQVSDITILSRHLRRVALAHVLLSFLNVTFILGLVVEIVSTLAASTG